MWAEEVGVGELGFSEEQFWRLTYREFNLKHDAFIRHEDRIKSWVIELASMTGSYNDQDKLKMQKAINALRRYPIKPWLASS